MIAKLNARGTSFKGLAAYLLHDKEAATDGRVTWTEAVNLATSNPQAAWRVMAATAMDSSRLKAQAGVKKTGRQSKESVLHLSLSWGPTEAPAKEEMSALARRALVALKADDRQALIICHSDTKHPHVHVIVNRVSPQDGRLLPSSKEKLALSALALAYEKEQGQIVCPQRAANAERREKGEYVRGEKEMPRPEFEAMRAAQTEAEKTVGPELFTQHPQIVAQLRADFRTRWRAQVESAADQLKTKWRGLYDQQRGRVAETQGMQNKALDQVAIAQAQGKLKDSASAQFAQESLSQVGKLKAKARQIFERERASLARDGQTFRHETVTAIRSIYEAGLKQLALFRPLLVRKDSAAGQQPIPQQNVPTEAQRRVTELAEKFRRESEAQPSEEKPANRVRPRPRDLSKDREWEP